MRHPICLVQKPTWFVRAHMDLLCHVKDSLLWYLIRVLDLQAHWRFFLSNTNPSREIFNSIPLFDQ